MHQSAAKRVKLVPTGNAHGIVLLSGAQRESERLLPLLPDELIDSILFQYWLNIPHTIPLQQNMLARIKQLREVNTKCARHARIVDAARLLMYGRYPVLYKKALWYTERPFSTRELIRTIRSRTGAAGHDEDDFVNKVDQLVTGSQHGGRYGWYATEYDYGPAFLSRQLYNFVALCVPP